MHCCVLAPVFQLTWLLIDSCLDNMQAGVDVAATLTAWGKWQPALAPGRGPSVAEALIGSLGGKGAERRVGLLAPNAVPSALL